MDVTFTQSATIANLITALLKFHSKVEAIAKKGENPAFKKNGKATKYAMWDDIVESIRPLLTECELVLQQYPDGEYGLTSQLSHVSGEWQRATMVMTPVEKTPQKLGGNITYQKRYSGGAILMLAFEEDDDGNASSGTSTPALPERKAEPRTFSRPAQRELTNGKSS